MVRSGSRAIVLLWMGLAVTAAGALAGSPQYDPQQVYADLNPPPAEHAMPPGLAGDAAKGLAIFNKTETGNCAACHCAAGAKGCGDIGPSLDKYRSALGAEPEKSDQWLFQQISDARLHNKDTVMPPMLPTKAIGAQDIVDLIAYLNSLK